MPVAIPFDKLNGLDPELVEESKGRGQGAKAEVTSGFVSTGSTNLRLG